MKDQFRRGKAKYISFILLDLLCLLIANAIAVRLYLEFSELTFKFSDYSIVVAYMMAIDVFVAVIFNTLNLALRRGIRREIVESIKQIGLSMVLLALLLFSTKQGAEFSRVTIYLAYGIYLVLVIVFRCVWKKLLETRKNDNIIPTALLVTTAGYAREGLGVAENSGIAVKGMFITDKTNEGTINNIPALVNRQDAAAFLCWNGIDKVYICGPESIDVPENLIEACRQMDIPVFTAPTRKNMKYEIVEIRTVLQRDDKTTGLSFFEGEHDIPFRINRLYTIFESEQNNQRGYHAFKQSWHMMFCPYGSIDVVVDTGNERKTIALNSPSTGLILHPSVWREMTWKKSGSVLCVAASGHYEADKLRDDYSGYLEYLQEKEWSATIESAEIMGDYVI